MYRKFISVMIMMLCISMIFSACSGNKPVNNELVNKESIDHTSPAGVFPSPDKSATSGIIFLDTIADSQAEYLNTLGGSKTTGTATLDLKLYEIKPNVFEGYGYMTRTLHMADESLQSKQEYVYRTGLFQAEAGREGTLTLTCSFTEDRDVETLIGEEAPFRSISHKEGNLLQKNLPFLLKLEGGKASLSIKIHDEANLVFGGKLTVNSIESARYLPKPEGLIYINSLWSDSFMGGSGDYTAILLAEPNRDKTGYSGQLSIDGNGDALTGMKEKVSFSLTQFEDAYYQKSGGKLIDRFTHMGVLHAENEDFILLLNGEQVILEPVGKGIFFYGKLYSEEEADFLQNEADKTIEMLSYLCRQKSNAASVNYSEFTGLDPNDPEDMQKLMELSEKLENMLGSESGVPAWYPDGLIPTVNFSEDDGYLTTPSIDAQIFKLYNTQYYENEDFTHLIAPYRHALSGLDNYKEYINDDNREGIFIFTMGRYSLQVLLQQSSLKLTSVDVLIY